MSIRVSGRTLFKQRNESFQMAVSGRRRPEEEFVSSLSSGSCEDFDIFCQPCDRDDSRFPAFGFCVDCGEHLCKQCFNYHKRAKPSMNHALLDEHNMPRHQQVPATTLVVPDSSGDLTTPCFTHKKEMIKFYCKDHSVLLCSVCVTLQHPSTVCHVDYIPEISGKSVDSNDYKTIIKQIDTMTKTLQDKTANLRKMTEKSNASLKTILVEIKKFRKEINRRLDDLEKTAYNAVDALTNDNAERLKAEETKCNGATNDLKTSSDAIKRYNESTQADKLFMELKAAEKLIRENEKMMSKLTPASDVTEYHFEPNAEISTVLEKETSLGKLMKTTRFISRNISHRGTINVNTAIDKESCFITGMALLKPEELVIADYKNKSVKMIELSGNSTKDQLKLNETPWDVTTVSENKLAVTLPFKQAVQFVSVSSGKLAKENVIKVDGKCYGIHFYRENLLVSFQIPPKLQVCDKKGNVLSTFSTNSNGVDIFREPRYLTANSSYIYVTDSEKKAVIKLNWQGKVTGYYKGSSSPAGIAMLKDGTFLLCDGKNCNIQYVSGDCTTGEVLLQNLKKPFPICWYGAKSNIYISSYTGEGSVDNFVQIYRKS